MLNELYQLSVALKEKGIRPYDWHKDLKPLPKISTQKPCYRILINQNGEVSGIELMKEKVASCLRKWEPSNGHSFPGFNIRPLYRLVDEKKKESLKKWREGKDPFDLSLLEELCEKKHENNWDEKFAMKMDKCLAEIPRQLQRRLGNIPNGFICLRNLCERLIPWQNDSSKRFFKALQTFVYSSLEQSKSSQFLLSILVHEGSTDKRPENDRGSISVFMDVPDWHEYPVAHEKTIKFINDGLLESESIDEAVNEESGLEDAYGYSSAGDKGKLPEVKLPVLGRVKLRAMNSESPCQYRYGTIDARSFRIGAESRKHTKSALGWLGSEEREGQTWGRADRKELIFAYPEVLPESPPKLAACFGTRKTDDTEARFANYAKDVVDCLRGLGRPLSEIKLHVFSLRKMDNTSAKTKVVFNRNYSAQRLADASKEWQQGCANIPVVRIKLWGKKKGETVLAKPETPFPLQVAGCLNRVWKLDGTTRDEVRAVSKTNGIELLLDQSTSSRVVPHLLTTALQNSKGLFLSLGNTLHRGEAIKIEGLNKQKRLMPAILGLLLYKLGIGKEAYMDHPSYSVGRMLKLADELHALYCKEVRNGNLPAQLLGNALMVAALDSPTQALAQLALRIAPYLGWARTNSTDSAGLSRYFLKNLGKVEEKLRDVTLPVRLDDPERAQLLLGYISGNPQGD